MIAGLILAAGESSRMGQDKALLTYRGRTFLETIIETLRAAGIGRIAVVLGHHAEEIQRAVKLEGVEIVVNRDYQRGQTSSLQAGLRALEASSAEAVVLCPVDHPAFLPETVRRLIEAFGQNHLPAAMPTFQNQRGHPVLISRELFGELLALPADRGANSVMRQHRDATAFIDTEDPGILLDVDDPEIYSKLESSNAPRPLT
jgi:molybdenum cofactor cytidylyltransferase